MVAGSFGVVIAINGNDYRLVLLDTNVLSEFAKEGESFRHFLTWSSAQPMFVPVLLALQPPRAAPPP